jgi:hypothetical protein
MNLDIETAVRTLFIFLLIATGAMVFTAVRAFQEASRLRFFLKKRELLSRAWKFIFFALLILTFGFLINSYAEPLTYSVFPPSPTVTLTPTVTQTATITITPTITLTPTITETPEVTPTPVMPAVISEGFTSQTTPNPNARFSEVTFSTSIDKDYQPNNPSDTFENPLDTIYGSFSYDQMITNSQWSALWFRDGEIVCIESFPWNGASGGFGFTECTLPGADWFPGQYEVQIFVGETWKASGLFTVTGTPPTPTITQTATITATPTITLTPTTTSSPTVTISPTGTAVPTSTLTPTGTVVPTSTLTPTPQPTNTSASAGSGLPTATLTLTPTQTRTLTPTITNTAEPTIQPTPTRYSTTYR